MSSLLKVAFVIPGDKAFGQQQYPLGIGYLAAIALEKGHDAIIIDEIAGDDVKEELSKYAPDVTCFTGTTMYINKVYEHAVFAKENIGSKIIIGGPHASALPQEALAYADIVMRTESEGNFLDALEGVIPNGIVKGEYVSDLDSIPIPAYHLLKIEHYLAQKDRIVGYEKRVASIITSRGCPWKCSFCYNSFRETPVRFHSPKRVIKEIDYLIRNHSIDGLYFCDDEFLLKPKRLEEICDYLKRENLIWECQAQVRSLLKHPEIIPMIKESGCVLLAVGFESGSDKVLQSLKGGASTVAMNQTILELTAKENLAVHGTFIIGSPGETMDDIKLTEKFINENRKGGLQYASVFKTTPFPGTKIWKQCEELGLLKGSYDWRDFDCGPSTPKANEFLTNEEIIKEVKRINLEQTLKNYSFWQILKRAWRYRKFIRNYLPFSQ